MSAAKTASLKAVYRQTVRLVGSEREALRQMASSADAVARAMSVDVGYVHAFIKDQRGNVVFFDRSAS